MDGKTMRAQIEKTDDLDTLSAIWILSCIDENPILTYRGIVARLALPDKFDVQALVRSRSELFRPGVLNSRLEAWKQQMKGGKNLPAWISEIRDKAEQSAAIDSITRDDVFRSQFRVEISAPKSDIEIIDWGLTHIERLRKSSTEDREARSKLWSTVVIPSASLFLVAASLAGTTIVQLASLREQRELKQYEVSFKPKQEAYADFMTALTNLALYSESADRENANREAARMDTSFYHLEAFLSASDRQRAFAEINHVLDLGNRHMNRSAEERVLQDSTDRFAADLALSKSYFRKTLYQALFSQ